VSEALLDKFSFWSSDTKNPAAKTLTVRKVGIKLSNLIHIEKKNPVEQRTLPEYF
jgi:hypothetical protein